MLNDDRTHNAMHRQSSFSSKEKRPTEVRKLFQMNCARSSDFLQRFGANEGDEGAVFFAPTSDAGAKL